MQARSSPEKARPWVRIESRVTDYVPISERHGHPRVLFPMWFAINIAVIAMVLGSTGIFTGLSLAWTGVAIVVGNALGAVFMALHSVQGPRIGMPQMIQSRAQFGVRGAAIPLILIVLMYIGYASANTVVAAQAISAVSPLPVALAIVLTMIVTTLVVVVGYDLIHKVQTFLTVVSGVFFVIVTVYVINTGLPGGAFSFGGFKVAPFITMAAIAGTWQLTYAPYVADYSRYLPRYTKASQTFLYTYIGTAVGAIWLMLLGAAVAVSFPKFFDNTTEGLVAVMGSGWTAVIFANIILGITLGNAVNLYGCFITTSTIISTWANITFTMKTRIAIIAACSIGVCVIGVLGYGNFVDNFSNFVNFLAYFIFPWTSINLADYFFVRRGRYRVAAFFDRQAEYGTYNLRALIPYIITVTLEIPFINTTIYQGYIAQRYGIDIAWIIAIFLPGLLYWATMRNKVTHNELIAADN